MESHAPENPDLHLPLKIASERRSARPFPAGEARTAGHPAHRVSLAYFGLPTQITSALLSVSLLRLLGIGSFLISPFSPWKI